MKHKLNQVWMRMGITLSLTADEMEKIVCGNEKESQAALVRIFSDGRAAIDGDSYIPGPVMEEYNRKYGTRYDKYDVDLETKDISQCKLRLLPSALRKNRGDAR